MRAGIEERIIVALKEQLLSPQAIELAVREYDVKSAELRASLADRRQPLERRLGEVKRRIDRLVDAIERGTATLEMEGRLGSLDQERNALERALAEMDANAKPVRLHPNAAAYAALVGQLHEALEAASNGNTSAEKELVESVRALVDRIELHPRSQERGSPIGLIIHGKLTGFLTPEPEHLRNEVLGLVVAGGHFRRPHTFAPRRFD